MKIRTTGFVAVALALGIGTYTFTAWSEEASPGFMGHATGMGVGPGIMMHGAHDSRTRAQLGVIHELLANHDRIKRTVTNLPNGIRTVTESDDPQVAAWIKTHVSSMGERVNAGDDPGLPIESPSLHAIFRDNDKIHTTTATIEKGVAVVQTSDDPNTVTELQTHAGEVTDLVEGGMAALHAAMIRNGGGMMNGGMMGGGMMRGWMPHGGMMQGPM